MSYILTYTKKKFDPLHPEGALLDIGDIAHALSLVCRANGHFKRFYSVARHSINCAWEARVRGYTRRVQLACLLHDASEAYLSDLTRPVKAQLETYRQLEAAVQAAVWQKWLSGPLSEAEQEQVRQVDDALLAHEFLELMDTPLSLPLPQLYSRPEFGFCGFETTEQEFLSLFEQLLGGRREWFCVGIDWMRPYWLAVELWGDRATLRKLVHISGINNHYLNADGVLIDIPIGLPETARESHNRPDDPARAMLPANLKSTLFPVPCRQAVGIADYEEASRINQAVLGKKLSLASHGLCKTIAQVDGFLNRDTHWKNRLLESHPELAFQRLNGDRPLRHSKHTDRGLDERIAIVRSHGLDPWPLLAEVTAQQHADVLDAAALALAARQGCQNGWQTIPPTPTADARGLNMQITLPAPLPPDPGYPL